MTSTKASVVQVAQPPRFSTSPLTNVCRVKKAHSSTAPPINARIAQLGAPTAWRARDNKHVIPVTLVMYWIPLKFANLLAPQDKLTALNPKIVLHVRTALGTTQPHKLVSAVQVSVQHAITQPTTPLLV